MARPQAAMPDRCLEPRADRPALRALTDGLLIDADQTHQTLKIEGFRGFAPPFWRSISARSVAFEPPFGAQYPRVLGSRRTLVGLATPDVHEQ